MSAPPATTIYLLRHAESAPDRVLAESEWPLSVRGEQQARQLAAHLTGLRIDQFVSSPFRRALATIAPAAAASAKPIAVEEDLRERCLTPSYADDWQALIRAAWSDLDLAHPGGESGRACQSRMVTCLARRARTHAGATVLACSHGNAIALFLNAIEPSVGEHEWRAMRTPELFRVHWRAGAWSWDRAFRAAIDD